MTLYDGIRAEGMQITDFLPVAGKRFAAANHNLRVQQGGVAVKKGVKVTLSFKARAYLP